MIVDTSYQVGFGLGIERMGGNGLRTDSGNMAKLATYINMLAGRRMHMLAQGGRGLTFAGSQLPVWARFHTSPNCGGVEVLIFAAPGVSATLPATYQFTVGGVAQGVRYIGGSATAAFNLGDIVIDRQRFTTGIGAPLSGDATYEATSAISNLTIFGYAIYEIPRTQLDTDNDAIALPTDVYGIGAPILDRDLAAMTNALYTMYKRQGATQFSWTNTFQPSPLSNASLTYANVLTGTTTGWSANEFGFWTIPYRKNRLTGNTVAVECWAYGRMLAGTGGTVRMVNSAGTLCTISGFTTTPSFRAASAVLDATLATSDLVIVTQAGNGTQAMETSAAGMYELA